MYRYSKVQPKNSDRPKRIIKKKVFKFKNSFPFGSKVEYNNRSVEKRKLINEAVNNIPSQPNSELVKENEQLNSTALSDMSDDLSTSSDYEISTDSSTTSIVNEIWRNTTEQNRYAPVPVNSVNLTIFFRLWKNI